MANSACAVQILEVAFSLLMCCSLVCNAIRKAGKYLRKHFGTLTPPLGQLQRHVRGDQHFPIGLERYRVHGSARTRPRSEGVVQCAIHVHTGHLVRKYTVVLAEPSAQKDLAIRLADHLFHRSAVRAIPQAKTLVGGVEGKVERAGLLSVDQRSR